MGSHRLAVVSCGQNQPQQAAAAAPFGAGTWGGKRLWGDRRGQTNFSCQSHRPRDMGERECVKWSKAVCNLYYVYTYIYKSEIAKYNIMEL